MRNQSARKMVAAALAAGAIVLSGSSATAMPTFDFTFTAQCDDCAFNGNPGDPGFDPLGDGLFQQVFGTLKLTDISLNASGNIDVNNSNFDSFEYGGSSLINPFTFTGPSTVTGEIAPGPVPDGNLLIQTSQGDFSNFCTALGEQGLGGCQSAAFAVFELDNDGDWRFGAGAPLDEGVDGQFSPVPEPGTAALLGLGLVGCGLVRGRSVRNCLA